MYGFTECTKSCSEWEIQGVPINKGIGTPCIRECTSNKTIEFLNLTKTLILENRKQKENTRKEITLNNIP